MRATIEPIPQSSFPPRRCAKRREGRMVGAAGFEPATWSTQNSRATRLRYAPSGVTFPPVGGLNRYTVANPPASGRAKPRSVNVSRQLVGGSARRIGPDFGGHHALRPRPEADQHRLARPQFRDAEAAQRLHVDEDVWGPVAAR